MKEKRILSRITRLEAAVDESGLFRELSERDYDIALYESDPWVTSYTLSVFNSGGTCSQRSVCLEVFQAGNLQLGGIRYALVFPKGILLSGHCSRRRGSNNAFGREQSNSVYMGSQRICHTYAGRKGDVSGGKCFGIIILQGRACLRFPV